MKLLLGIVLLPLAILCPAVRSAESANVPPALANAAFLAAFGRLPQPAEISGVNGDRFDAAFAELSARLAADPAERRNVIVRSYRDAFGRGPTPTELSPDGPATSTYVDLMRRHVARLASDSAAFEQLLHHAYQLVISRDVYPEEIAYWQKVGPVPFALVVAAVDNWARRNQPGLMVTTGKPTISVNCGYLTTVRLLPEQASAVRTSLGIQAPTTESHTIIAIGAGSLQSNGHIAFVAAGNERLDQ